MTDPLTTLEQDLTTLATPDSGNPQTGTATPSSSLTAAQTILSLLADQSLVGSSIGTAVAGFYTAIAGAINDDVVKALQAIAQELSTLTVEPAETGAALTALQNALQTAGSLVPGGSSALASALAATTQFTTLFGNLLSDASGGLDGASTELYEIAQQLAAIATALTAAAAGNP